MRNLSGNYFEFRPVVHSEILFKEFLLLSVVEILHSGAEPTFAILVEGIMGNIQVKSFENWTRFRRRCCLRCLYFS